MQIHRYLGLALAGFLAIAGLTGALLVFERELDEALNPQLLRVQPPLPGAAFLDPLAVREAVQARYPDARVHRVDLAPRPGEALALRIEQSAGMAAGVDETADDQVFVNPYTGEILGARKWGDLAQGLKNLMPFIYRLHYSLAAGSVGQTLMGIVALLWTVDCFIALYLTFPAGRRRAGGRHWLVRWWPSWKLRWGDGSYKRNFDLHRAGGLWPWAMLFVLAWSSVAFNLPGVYDPVMHALFLHQPQEKALPKLARAEPEPAIGWWQAREIGRRLMADEARAQGFTVQEEQALYYDPQRGVYRYQARSSLDIRDQRGSTRLVFDADTGALRNVRLPTGAASGDTIRTWLASLHMAALWGMPFRILVCTIGLVVAMLSVTGVAIWAKKRSGRIRSAGRREADVPDGPGCEMREPHSRSGTGFRLSSVNANESDKP